MIHDLPEKLHLFEPVLCRVPHLRENLRLGPHPFMAACVRDHAEAAVLVAPFDDRDPGSDWIATAGQPEGKSDVVVSAEIELRTATDRGLIDEHR